MPLKIADTSILPPDVLLFCDDGFYDFVAKVAGTTEAKLLEIQGIRSVYSFLCTEDVFEILTVSCSALNFIKKSICFEADDKSFIIKPGCRSNIRYLYQLLHQKHEEHLKQISSKSKRNKSLMSQDENIVTDNTQDSIQSSSTPSQANSTTASNASNTSNRRDFLIHTLNEWTSKHGTEIGIPNGKLIENEDFHLSIRGNESDASTTISCSCGINVQLGYIRGNISLSNFYKHLKSKTCIIRRKISKRISGESNETFDEGSSNVDGSRNNSMSDEIECLASTISIDKPATISKSFKRTIDQENNTFSRKKRI